MAEGFEPYHVPQQSRRDKLRVVNNPPGCVDNLQGCAALVPLYDPSLISSDLINCAAAAANLHHHSYNLSANTSAGVKVEGMSLMGFLGGMNTNHMYVDPQLSVQLNPSTIQDINGNPYVYASSHCFRPVLDQSFHVSEGHNSNNTANSTGQTLSLSLSSHHSNLPLELNLQRYDSTVFGNNEKGSRFLKPAQQLLEEFCDVGRGIYADKNGVDSTLLDPPPLECLSGGDDSVNCSDGGEQTRKKSRLLSMLDEVYKRYKQYYQQMQAAVAAFESVAGLSNAAPFAYLALKAMSKHFRCLKNAITDQLQFTSKSQVKMNSDQRDESQRSENSGRATYGQRPFHSGFVDHPVWRPQRGLPERAVTVLRAWLFDHFLHPYPTDTDKIMLAKQTGLSRNQVSNWFINARVRLWKPMVEEIHMLETRQGQKASQTEQQQQKQPLPHTPKSHLPTSCSIGCDNASTSTQRIGEFPLKRTREDPSENGGGSVEQMNLLRSNPLVGVGLSNGGSGNGGVSLTLGLYQNGVGLSDSYPINAARRFGLDSHGDQGFVGSGFAAQNQQFGRDLIDRQIMHDFVG